MANSSPQSKPGALFAAPKFSGVLLVCGECEKRGSGPAKLKAKHLRKELKRHANPLPVRLRIVECSCLGVCPQKAITVVGMLNGQTPCAAELHSAGEAEAVVAAMRRHAGM